MNYFHVIRQNATLSSVTQQILCFKNWAMCKKRSLLTLGYFCLLLWGIRFHTVKTQKMYLYTVYISRIHKHNRKTIQYFLLNTIVCLKVTVKLDVSPNFSPVTVTTVIIQINNSTEAVNFHLNILKITNTLNFRLKFA